MSKNPQLRSAVYGAAVGDALGVPYEFRAGGTFECTGMVGHGSHDVPAGTFSDDTSMTLATCDSLRATGGAVDVDDMRRRFIAWMEQGAYAIDGRVFDIGGTTAAALRAGVGAAGEHDNGNGSLMRILPLAFTDATDDQIAQVSAITHAHSTSRRACVTYVHLARDLAAGMSVADAIAHIEDTAAPFTRLHGIAKLPRNEIRSSGYVVDTLEAALWCLATTTSYLDCVRAAVNLGEDTDTVAAVAGGLAAIVYGENGIPSSWLDTLRSRDIIDRCLF